MVTIKEYAKSRGKSVQAVYKQINGKENNKKLEGHILIQRIGNKDTKVLDDEAVKILDHASSQSPQIVVQTDDKERIVQLEAENKSLLLKVTELQDALLKEKNESNRLAQEKFESQKLLIDSNAEVKILEAEKSALEERVRLLETAAAEQEAEANVPKRWWQFWK